MDAVDAALVDLGGTKPDLIATARSAWPEALGNALQSLASGHSINATDFALLDTRVGAHFAEVVNGMLSANAIPAAQIEAIGCHGQTVAHTPDTETRTTLQLGDANIIAERTGITTINDFRRRDMAAGGQGAPLAPAFHEAFLRDSDEDRIVLNLGGIANVTVLPADPAQATRGFDTGPANCLMDGWTQRHLGARFDKDGAWAASAPADDHLLSQLLEEPFFAMRPPKSTGTQHFSARWLENMLGRFGDLPPAGVQATLLALTAHTVADTVREHAPETRRIMVCGGGARNTALIHTLADVSGRVVESTAAYGIDPDWMEAMAFAWLAQRTLAGKAGNLPSVTGACGPRILGAIHPAG
jgi:anhydro-N-acetylmuramic acid kinase